MSEPGNALKRPNANVGVGAGLVLAVDLNGSLIASDIADECLWAGLAQAPLTTIGAVFAWFRGPAAFKAALARAALPDLATLPYRAEVLELIRTHKAQGGRVVLATAADREAAEALAQHLGLFDAVLASDGVHNLKGEAKAAALVQAYGERGFAYVGNSHADLPIWARAAQGVTVAASPRLHKRAEAANPAMQHLGSPKGWGKALIRALRPHQWVKNFLVFVPVLAAHRFDAGALSAAAFAFVAFSLMASAVYVLNDLLDLAADRQHPHKRARPFAAGQVPLRWGLFLIPLLSALAILGALWVGVWFMALLFGYWGTTLAYSLDLKRRALADLATLASLYAARVVGGALAAGVTLSVWLITFSVFFFFSLAALKRVAELVELDEQGGIQASGRGYRTRDLSVLTQIASAAGFVSVLVLMLYLTDPDVVIRYQHPGLLWGVALILLYWVSRAVLKAARGQMREDPVLFVLRDRVSIAAVVLCIGLIAGAIGWR